MASAWQGWSVISKLAFKENAKYVSHRPSLYKDIIEHPQAYKYLNRNMATFHSLSISSILRKNTWSYLYNNLCTYLQLHNSSMDEIP